VEGIKFHPCIKNAAIQSLARRQPQAASRQPQAASRKPQAASRQPPAALFP